MPRRFAAIALVHQRDGNAARQESHFAEALGQRFKFVINAFFENRFIRLKALRGAVLALIVLLDLPGFLNFAGRLAALIALAEDFAIATHLGLQPLAEAIDRADAHAMQAG